VGVGREDGGRGPGGYGKKYNIKHFLKIQQFHLAPKKYIKQFNKHC